MRLRTAAGSLALVPILAASGCATSGFADGPHDTITILTHYGNDPLKSGLQEMVDEWNSGHPDLQVETQAVAYDDLLQTMTVRQTGGQAPDIVQAYSLWGGQLDAAGVLADVPDDIVTDIRDNYAQAAVGSVTAGDKVLGYPTEVQTYNLYYNKKLFADAGIDSPPSTWEELEEAARKTTVHDDLGNVRVSGFGLANDFDSAVVHPFASMLQAAGGRYLDPDGTADFDSPAGRDALSLEKRLIDDGFADPSVDILKAFPGQTAAMTINAGWWLGTLQATMGDDYANIGVAPIPGPDAGDRGSLAYGYFTGVDAQSRHQDEAWRFLKWLNAERTDTGATRMGSFQFSLGTVPGRTSDVEVLAGGIDDPNYAPFIDALEYALPEPNAPGGQEMKTSMQTNIESVWTGQKTVDEALADAAAEADAILDRQR